MAHLIVLRLGLSFAAAQGVATSCAIVGNFVLNDLVTFKDRRLKGPRLWRSLLTFSAVCGAGPAASLNIAALMVDVEHQTWWAAGVVGAAMSLVWNYAVGSTLTWRRQSCYNMGQSLHAFRAYLFSTPWQAKTLTPHSSIRVNHEQW